MLPAAIVVRVVVTVAAPRCDFLSRKWGQCGNTVLRCKTMFRAASIDNVVSVQLFFNFSVIYSVFLLFR